jgi:hypothetical protein
MSKELREAAELIYKRISDHEEWYQSIESAGVAKEVAKQILALAASPEAPGLQMADDQGPLKDGSKIVVAYGIQRWLAQILYRCDDVERPTVLAASQPNAGARWMCPQCCNLNYDGDSKCVNCGTAAPPSGQPATRPEVIGAIPVCLDCNAAGIRNCSHFDNCDGKWVYKPSPSTATEKL